MPEEIFTIGKTETKRIVYESNDAVIFEGGWWMTGANHRKMHGRYGWEGYRWGLDKNDRTRELTPYLLP